MPSAVSMFARLSYGSLLIGLLGSVYLLPKLLASMKVELQAVGGWSFIAPVLLFSFAIPLLLIWLAASRRKNWARVLLAIMFLLGLAITASDTSAFQIGGWPSIAFFVVQTLVQAVALYYVFSAEAKPWFAKPSPAQST